MSPPKFSIEINPTGVSTEYLRALNTCFGKWGDRRTYEWYLERRSPGYFSDLIVLFYRDRMVAGSAVTYRNAAHSGGGIERVGIMTGSWTLPEARGQGCFGRLIEQSLQLCRQRSCPVLLAFVTANNASCRQLERAGAAMAPTYYLFSTQATPRPVRAAPLVSVKPTPYLAFEAQERLDLARRLYSRFAYASIEEFTAQFVDRPMPVEVLRAEDGSLSFVERTDDTQRLQLLVTDNDTEADWTHQIASHLELAAAKSQTFFLFSIRDTVRDACVSLGMDYKKGFLTTLATGANLSEANSFLRAKWDIQNGERA